ncbi:hypothetical protein Scep_021532 [Stephania cephalantha]|uniref:Uncharacterized protein n=1 Tax=Stephania cephalantha TaxID=152367 RepID=A0AAP0F8P2_9MAGN
MEVQSFSLNARKLESLLSNVRNILNHGVFEVTSSNGTGGKDWWPINVVQTVKQRYGKELIEAKAWTTGPSSRHAFNIEKMSGVSRQAMGRDVRYARKDLNGKGKARDSVHSRMESNVRAELMRATPAKPRRETPTDWVVACLINRTEEQMASNAKLSCGFIPSSPGFRDNSYDDDEGCMNGWGADNKREGQQEDGENAQGTLVGIEPQDDFRMDDSSEADSDEGTPIDDMDNADEDD